MATANGREETRIKDRETERQRDMDTKEISTYEIGPDGLSITCLFCGMTSHHPMDVRMRYCVNCHVFHDDIPPEARKDWLEGKADQWGRPTEQQGAK